MRETPGVLCASSLEMVTSTHSEHLSEIDRRSAGSSGIYWMTPIECASPWRRPLCSYYRALWLYRTARGS